MNKSLIIICTGLSLMAGNAHSQWGNWGGMPGGSSTSNQNMMPWGGMPGGSSMSNQNMMPWGGQGYSRPQYNQQPYGSNFMPWGGSRAPAYQAPPQQPFGGGMMPWGGNRTPPPPPPQQQPFGGMMPWGNSAPAYSQPQSQGYMMPGMDQGIRSMMQPGKIMAEEATPGMHMKPTWR